MLLNVRLNHWVCELTVKGVGEQSLRSKSPCKVSWCMWKGCKCVCLGLRLARMHEKGRVVKVCAFISQPILTWYLLTRASFFFLRASMRLSSSAAFSSFVFRSMAEDWPEDFTWDMMSTNLPPFQTTTRLDTKSRIQIQVIAPHWTPS